MKNGILKEANKQVINEEKKTNKLRKERDKKRRKEESLTYVDTNINLGIGNKQLTEKQSESLNEIKKSIDEKVNQSWWLRHGVKLAVALIAAVVIIPWAVKVNYVGNNLDVSTNLRSSEADTVIKISMDSDTNNLKYDISSVMLKAGNHYLTLNKIPWLESDINIETEQFEIDNKIYNVSKEMHLSSLQLAQDTVYMQYKNVEKTASKELIFTSKGKDSLKSDTLVKTDARTFEDNNALGLKIYRNSYYNTLLFISERVAGGKLADKELTDELDKIEGSVMVCDDSLMTYQQDRGMEEQERSKGNIVIEFDGYHKIYLNDIPELKDAVEVVYSDVSDVLRVRNHNENIDYMYICGIDNEVIGCNANDLVASTQDNIYLHKDFDTEGSSGYKVFGIKTGNSLYIIKVNGIAHESIISNTLKQLGYDTETKLTIKKVQNVVPAN